MDDEFWMKDPAIAENVKNCLEGMIPISRHPLFSKTYDQYAEAYNKLAEELDAFGIDIQLLIHFDDKKKELDSLAYIIAYLYGFKDGMTIDTD
jgi:hypothetical protein